MNNEIAIILTLSAIIFASPLLSKIIKIPTIPVEIILGSIVISLGIIEEHPILDLVAELGFLYLLFLVGLEIDLKKLFKVDRSIIKKGLLYTALLYIITLGFCFYFNLPNIFIVTIPLISIGLLAAIKKEYGDLPWINLSIIVGLIGEIVSIVVLTVVSAKLEHGIGSEFYFTLLELLGVFLVVGLFYKFFHNLVWWYPGIKTYLMPKFDNQEQDIRLSMAVFFLMCALMHYLHLEVALGGFIAGVFIATFFTHNKELPHKLEHFGFGWLVPIFFIWVGTSLQIESIFMDNVITIAFFITVAMITLRFVSSLLFIKELGFKGVLLFVHSHSMPLTLVVAVATLAYHTNSISDLYYIALILAAILEVILCMTLIRIISKFKVKIKNNQ